MERYYGAAVEFLDGVTPLQQWHCACMFHDYSFRHDDAYRDEYFRLMCDPERDIDDG